MHLQPLLSYTFHSFTIMDMNYFRFPFPNISYPIPTSTSNSWHGFWEFGNGAQAESQAWIPTNYEPPDFSQASNFANPIYVVPESTSPPINFGGSSTNNGFYHHGGVVGDVNGSYATNFSSRINNNDNTGANEDNRDFEVKLNVSKYKMEELNVRAIDSSTIIVKGKKFSIGEHGTSSRNFERRYQLPQGIPSDNLTCRLTSDGYLILSAERPRISHDDSKDADTDADPGGGVGGN